ncbi:MAG: DUF4129 domain-containing protein [Marmoricola sp.]
MTASLRRTVIVSVAALGVAFVLVWAASSSPVVVAGGEQQRSVVPQDAQQETPDRTAQEKDEDEDTPSSDTGVVGTTSWAEDLVVLALVLATLGLLGLVVRHLLVRVARSLPDKQLVLDLDPRPDVEAGRDAVVRDRDRYLEALAGSDVRDGIVACWVLMERAAAEAGVAPRPAETATELVVRFLHALDVDPRPVAALAGLYHEARFSSHPMGDGARRQARGALEAIQRELAQARVTP